jgi:hypothetical protein
MLLTRNATHHNSAGRRQQQQQQPLRQQQQQQSEPQGSVVVGIHHYSGSWMDWDLNNKQKEEKQLNEEVGWGRCGKDTLLIRSLSHACSSLQDGDSAQIVATCTVQTASEGTVFEHRMHVDTNTCVSILSGCHVEQQLWLISMSVGLT